MQKEIRKTISKIKETGLQLLFPEDARSVTGSSVLLAGKSARNVCLN